ncbi:site-specific integrase [Salegentibacter sp. LM13S]|uniref:tyrosine-type recombinase/integrase n=1 Tax=Salegentibacter lacus TaxID=2873599 RepID=UPI001CCCABC6|nr:site-specific integrase [Salegentibacter lacus]MBZ9632644.1 site-specific integrase [Salegentibacter lacus]
MKIISVKFNNSYKPILIKDFTPVYLPFKYTILKLKSKSFKTQYNHLYSIRLMLEYFESRNISFQSNILNSKFEELVENLENLISWIYNNESFTKQDQNLSPTTYNNHLRRINDFLVWSIRYDQNNLNIDKRIASLFKSHIINNNSNPGYKSISKGDLNKIFDCIHPSSISNPFASRNRLRNFVILLIFLDTGLRLAELLLIKTDHLIRDENQIYLKIFQEFSDPEDSRKTRPRIKNKFSERVIGLSQSTFEILDIYIQRHRKKNKKHSFLFTSDIKGNPIAKNTISYIFSTISKKLDIKFSPHLMRHNFAERMLQYLIEERKIDMPRAQDELRTILGWSYNSLMPNLYAKNYISDMANKHNMERISNENNITTT